MALRKKFVAVSAASIMLGGVLGAGIADAAISYDSPPQCVETVLAGNSGNGPIMYVKWCGTGANGPSPVKSTVHHMTVDGGMLNRYCTKAVPCVVVWP